MRGFKGFGFVAITGVLLAGCGGSQSLPTGSPQSPTYQVQAAKFTSGVTGSGWVLTTQPNPGVTANFTIKARGTATGQISGNVKVRIGKTTLQGTITSGYIQPLLDFGLDGQAQLYGNLSNGVSFTVYTQDGVNEDNDSFFYTDNSGNELGGLLRSPTGDGDVQITFK